MKRRKATQKTLPFRTWGGKRKGAGRKPKGRRAGVSHRPRAEVDVTTPVHVTWRLLDEVRDVRRKFLWKEIRVAMRGGKERFGFRLLQLSLQNGHIHAIVEADDAAAFRRGMQGLTIRLARAINRSLRRHGKVFADRYHSRPVTSPREARALLVYVLNNARKHASMWGGHLLDENRVDGYSTAPWFDGWRASVLPLPPNEPSPIAEPKS
ncbi:MAG TPA: transposase, partial [Candidatus Paceibacterota bacterium]|nr:transposase [Candidatus Paceibacterota bacterium]